METKAGAAMHTHRCARISRACVAVHGWLHMCAEPGLARVPEPMKGNEKPVAGRSHDDGF